MGTEIPHNTALIETWDREQGKIARLNEDPQGFFDSIPALPEAFMLRDQNIRCIDEGTPGGIHVAGSGILLTEAQAQDYVAKALADGVWSHASCGAAALYARSYEKDPSRADEYGIEWAKKLAELTGIPYLGHITELARPKEFHVAGVAYYDGTGAFDPSRCPELPKGFVVSRRYHSTGGYPADEMKVCFDIAHGAHGFGELITVKNPFVFVVVGDYKNQEFSSSRLAAELAQTREASEGLIRIVIVTAPIN